MLGLNGDSCPYCSGANLRRYSSRAYDTPNARVNIVECRSCEAAWQWPLQRKETDSARIFAQAYQEQKQDSYFDPVKRDAVASLQRDFIETRASGKGRLLDVGCGDGHFARHMATHGWQVVGLDPAILSPGTECVGTGSLTLAGGDLSGLGHEATFDVITLWDVVEHVENPSALVADASRHLAAGGLLVVETGNYQSEGRAFHEDEWWNFQVDHRWYFSPPQLKALLMRNGLSNVEMLESVLRPWWKGRPDMPRPRMRSLVKAVALNPLKMIEAWRQFKERRRVRQEWSGWSGLEIMVMFGERT
ncbi:MAG: class I SAM-dependent methyltransferase [Rhodoferax sp.]|nr:class I SAM-dependent methyltransferase [Rhodoferax sp.]